MKPMRIMVIENDFDNKNMISIRQVLEELCGGVPRIFNDQSFLAARVEEEYPDMILVDIALSGTEESQINTETKGGVDCKLDFCAQLSGVRYCEKAKGSYPNVPLVLMSQFDRPNVIAACLAAGADGFLPKGTGLAAIRSALKAAYMRGKTRDVAFFDAISQLLKEDTCWRKSHIQSACEEFFSRGSPGRRLIRLWVSLADLVVDGIDEGLVTELIGVQVDAEALLLAANPRMRDHLSHSGNVFWLGYHLINTISGFRNCVCTATHNGAGVQSRFTDPKDHIHCAWILCSLLHDVAYLRDRIATVEDRLNTGRKFFGLRQNKVKNRVATFPVKAMTSLKNYLSSPAFGDRGERLASSLTSVEVAWGKPRVGAKSLFEDHGVVAAGALLDAIKEDKRTAEVMHAAAAMALHNLPKWVKDLKLADNIELPFDLLPCANLLALCDELQGWGREPASDPLSFNGRTLQEMRGHVKEGYIEGSHIGHFAVGVQDTKATVELTIHYEMAPGEGCAGATLRTDIIKWRRNRASDVSSVLKLSDHFASIKISHLIPDEKPEPEDVYLAGQP